MTHPNYKTALYLAAIFAAFFWAQWDDNRHEWPESDELQAVQMEEAAKARIERADRAVCGPSAVAQRDGDVLTCTPKRSKSYTVAKGESHE